jgi:hypothetical protein
VNDTNGLPYFLVSNCKQVWESWMNGRFERAASLEGAISPMEGVTSGALVVIPSALLPIEWSDEKEPPWIRGRFLEVYRRGARLGGEAKVAGHLCYRVVCARKAETWTFWVDKTSYLLRKSEQTISPVQQKLWGGGLSGQIRSTVQTESYNVQSLNQPIATRLFDDPTK